MLCRVELFSDGRLCDKFTWDASFSCAWLVSAFHGELTQVLLLCVVNIYLQPKVHKSFWNQALFSKRTCGFQRQSPWQAARCFNFRQNFRNCVFRKKNWEGNPSQNQSNQRLSLSSFSVFDGECPKYFLYCLPKYERLLYPTAADTSLTL